MTLAAIAAASRQRYLEKVLCDIKTESATVPSLRKPVAPKVVTTASDVELSAEARSPKRSAEELRIRAAFQISTEAKAEVYTCTVARDSSETLHSEPVKTWSVEDAELVDWCLSLSPEQLPTPPFKLYQHATIMGTLFYEQLKKDIEADVSGSRARTGALQGDLKKLRELMNEKRVKTGVNVRQDDILDIENATIKGDDNGH